MQFQKKKLINKEPEIRQFVLKIHKSTEKCEFSNYCLFLLLSVAISYIGSKATYLLSAIYFYAFYVQ